MTPLSSDTLIAAANRIITEIGEYVENTDALDLQRLELCARGLCLQLKAIHDLDTHNQRMAAIDIGQTYTRYEDLPPPSPAEQDRFYARLESSVTQIETGEPIPRITQTFKTKH